MASRRISSFHLGDLLLGVDVLKVQEVLRHQPTTPVPLAPPEVRGLINLRGEILTAIDLRHLFGLAPREDRRAMNVVLKSDGGGVSLLADAIGDVVEIDQGAVEEPPSSLAPRVRGLLTGVVQLERRLLLLLDTDAVVHVHSA